MRLTTQDKVRDFSAENPRQKWLLQKLPWENMVLLYRRPELQTTKNIVFNMCGDAR